MVPRPMRLVPEGSLSVMVVGVEVGRMMTRVAELMLREYAMNNAITITMGGNISRLSMFMLRKLPECQVSKLLLLR